MPHTAPGASVDVPASLRRRSTPGRAWWHATAENLFPFLIVGAAWELVARLQIFPARLFPPLEEVAVARLTASGILPHHALDTVVRLLAGFALAALVGVAIGFAMGRSRRAEDALLPIVSVGAPVPGLAYAPLFMLWFGLGDLPAVLLVAFVSAFPIVIKYMQEQAEILLREKKIKAIPDWKKALRPEFMQRAGG